MKSITILLVAVFFFSYEICAQNMYISFDVPYNYSLLFQNDTFRSSKPWQIGIPDKSVFKYESNHKRVLATDTLNSLGKNDTFSIILKYIRKSGGGASVFRLRFEYFMNGNSNDKGIVELSPDQGKNWVNLLTQDTTYDIFWRSKKPELSGVSNQWDTIYLDISNWDNFDDYSLQLTRKDTILFRYTYITDSMNMNRDGWMIDNVLIEYGWTSINSIYKDNGVFFLSPNPASDVMYIENKLDLMASKVEIFNSLGQKVLSCLNTSSTKVDLNSLPDGIYSVLIQSEAQWYSQKLVIIRE